jgi:hypothetical protein
MSALMVHAMTEAVAGTADRGRTLAERSMAVARETGVDLYEGHCSVPSGWCALAAGATAEARVFFDRALELIGFLPSAAAISRWGLTVVELADDNVNRAHEQAEMGSAWFRATPESWMHALGLLGQAWVALAQADDERADAFARAALAAMRAMKMKIFAADAIEVLAAVAWRRGLGRDGTRLLGAASSWRAGIGEVRFVVNRVRHESLESSLRDALGAEEFETAWRHGESSTLEEVM